MVGGLALVLAFPYVQFSYAHMQRSRQIREEEEPNSGCLFAAAASEQVLILTALCTCAY